MGKFDGILLCTDLDGTLLRNDKTISKENKDAIHYFQKEGGRFTFITGRMPYLVEDIHDEASPNCAFGCINGGGVYDWQAKEYLWKITLPESALTLVEYVDKELPTVGIQANLFDKLYFCKENSAMTRFRELTGASNLTCPYQDIKEPIAKILFGSCEEDEINRLEALLNAHPLKDDFTFIRSEKILYEILPKGISKANALMKIAEFSGISMEKTIAVGDYNNDIGMLCAAKVGFAVANARPEVKAAADAVTVSNEEHAIAKIIEDLDKGECL